VPDTGSIAFGDTVVAGDGVRPMPPQTRRVGYVPQEGALFPHLDVAANIAFGLGREARESRADDRVAEMLDLVELPVDFRDRRPDELSGGQQQRVALARSLAPQPAVVLLDEPFSSLDASLRGSTSRAVRRALQATSTTGILVTHDQNEALSLADEVAVMRAGRLVQSASPSQVYLSPSDPQVAEFVGRAVVLPGTANAAHATCALGQVVLTEPTDGEVALMIRPEQVYVDLVHAEGVRGTVEEVSYYGHDCAVQVRLDDGTSVLSRMSGVLHPVAGDTVHLRVTGLVRAYRPAGSP
jgi:iron(III) transport system ATP-binding protein